MENSSRDANTRPPYLPPEKSVFRSRNNRPGHGHGSKLVKEYIKAVYCHPVYLTYAEYIKRNAGLDKTQAGFKIARRNISNLRYIDDITLMAEEKRN